MPGMINAHCHCPLISCARYDVAAAGDLARAYYIGRCCAACATKIFMRARSLGGMEMLQEWRDDRARSFFGTRLAAAWSHAIRCLVCATSSRLPLSDKNYEEMILLGDKATRGQLTRSPHERQRGEGGGGPDETAAVYRNVSRARKLTTACPARRRCSAARTRC